MKKGFILGLATGLTIAGASLALASSQIQAILNDQIQVSLNGQIQVFKDETTNETQYPITYQDRTYLPLRTVANLVGVGVDYDAKTNTAILTNDTNVGSITVEDAVNYTDSYYSMFKVKLPKVTGNTKAIQELNQKILNEVLPRTYSEVISHAMIPETLDKGSTYDYQYLIKNDILLIYIKCSAPAGSTLSNSLPDFAYYYDIANDKILTISEAASKTGLISAENTPEDLNRYIIIIENNELKLQFEV